MRGLNCWKVGALVLSAFGGADVTLARTRPGGTHAVTLASGATDAGQAAMRDPGYRGIKRALVLAQYGPGGEIAGGVESDALCEEVLAVVRQDAPVPADCARIGEPALADGAALVVIVQASVVRDATGGDRLFAVTVRPHHAGGLEPDPHYFGAAPLVVRYAETPAGRAARATAIGAALDQILPWRRGAAARAR